MSFSPFFSLSLSLSSILFHAFRSEDDDDDDDVDDSGLSEDSSSRLEIRAIKELYRLIVWLYRIDSSNNLFLETIGKDRDKGTMHLKFPYFTHLHLSRTITCKILSCTREVGIY